MYKKLVLVALLMLGVRFVLIGDTAIAATVTTKIYSDASDWGMSTFPYPGSWDVQHQSTIGNDPQMQTYRSPVYVGAYHTPTGYLAIYRSFLSFDTSVIPDDATIISASMKIHPDIILNDYPSDQSYVAIMEGKQASPTEFSLDDVEMCGDTVNFPTLLSNKVEVSSVILDSELLIPLNSGGIDTINVSGFTKLCLREGHDIENIEVTNNDSFWKASGITYYTSEHDGTSTDPYLEVTYEIPDKKTLGELLEELRGYVKTEVKVKTLRELYLTNLVVFEKLYGRVPEHISLKHLEILKKRVALDVKRKFVPASVGEEIVRQVNEIIELLENT